MQIKETLSQGLKREFDIKIPASEVEKKLITRLESIGKKVKIPGFRPGKVPLDLLKKRYKAEVLSEVIEDCVDSGIKQVIKEKDIKPSLKPNVNIKSYEEEKDLDIELKMEVLPVIGDINLDNLSFEKYVVEVPAQAISTVIETIAKRNRETHPIQNPRKTKQGDIVIVDFEGVIDDQPIEGGAGKAHPLELGSGSFIPGFEDQLIGQDKGSHVTVNVTFPKEYHEDRYANKPARFDVTIIDIHEADPISIDSALATKLGFDSLEAMQGFVQQNIVKDYTGYSFMNTKRHVLDALAKRFVFEVPENMVNMEFENIWEQLCRELGIDQKDASNANLKKGEKEKSFEELAGKNEEELRREYKTIAERRVRLGLVLAEIGNRNKLTVSNQELLNALMAKAKEFPGQEKEIFEFYRNSAPAMDSLRAPIFENKVVDFILGQSTVTEKKVTPEELEKILSFEEEEAEKMIVSQSEKPKTPKKKKEGE
ncbi:MAG: trigger factor [Alphaproteobacteria bacterium]|nr:trigger factor [Alphaproteobacteria bacterium]